MKDRPDGPARQRDADQPAKFLDLVLMLGDSALAHLGAGPGAAEGGAGVDVERARQAIDLLDLLKQKTAGNLTSQEASVLDAVLFDLRIRFVNVVKKP